MTSHPARILSFLSVIYIGLVYFFLGHDRQLSSLSGFGRFSPRAFDAVSLSLSLSLSICVSLALMTFSGKIQWGLESQVDRHCVRGCDDLLLALFRSTSSWSPLSIEMGETEFASRRPPTLPSPPPPSMVDDVLEFSSVFGRWCRRGSEEGGDEDGLCPEPVKPQVLHAYLLSILANGLQRFYSQKLLFWRVNLIS